MTKNSNAGESAYATSERTSQTDDERIVDVMPLPPPEHLIRFFPIAGTPVETQIGKTRESIRRIMQRQDDRLLVIMGPCSIHDPLAAVEYAKKLKVEARAPRRHARDRHAGLLREAAHDRRLEGAHQRSLPRREFPDRRRAAHRRQLLLEINPLGMPAGSEFLDVISPQYLGDLIAWGAIGARTTESQVHRELASGLSAPIGFKNGTDGNIRSPSMRSRRRRVRTTSSRSTRTARSPSSRRVATPTATSSCVAARRRTTTRRRSPPLAGRSKRLPALHADGRLQPRNSSKDHLRQVDVAKDVAGQLRDGNRCIFGVMVESHLQAGAQKFTAGRDDPTRLEFAKSITDACIGWDDSIGVLETLSSAVLARRARPVEPVALAPMGA